MYIYILLRRNVYIFFPGIEFLKIENCHVQCIWYQTWHLLTAAQSLTQIDTENGSIDPEIWRQHEAAVLWQISVPSWMDGQLLFAHWILSKSDCSRWLKNVIILQRYNPCDIPLCNEVQWMMDYLIIILHYNWSEVGQPPVQSTNQGLDHHPNRLKD